MLSGEQTMEQLKELVAAQAVRNKHLPKEPAHKGAARRALCCCITRLLHAHAARRA